MTRRDGTQYVVTTYFWWRERIKEWRVNAPFGYRWTRQDVLHEKTQSFLNGVIFGSVLWGVIAIVVLTVIR